MTTSCFHVVLILTLLIIPRAVDSLNCYSCQSQVSLDDCKSKQKETSCPSGTPDCVTGVLTCSAGEVTKKVFYKGCGAKGDDCDISSKEEPSCPSSPTGWSFSSTNSCCSGNNCNGASSPKNSGPLRYASVMLAGYLLLAIWMIVFMY